MQFVLVSSCLKESLTYETFQTLTVDRNHVLLRRPAVPGRVRQVGPRRVQEVQGEDREGRAAVGRDGAVAHVRRQAGRPINRKIIA